MTIANQQEAIKFQAIKLSLFIRFFFKGSSAFFYLTLPVAAGYFSVGSSEAIVSASLF